MLFCDCRKYFKLWCTWNLVYSLLGFFRLHDSPLPLVVNVRSDAAGLISNVNSF